MVLADFHELHVQLANRTPVGLRRRSGSILAGFKVSYGHPWQEHLNDISESSAALTRCEGD